MTTQRMSTHKPVLGLGVKPALSPEVANVNEMT
jgi:hypothetical protein